MKMATTWEKDSLDRFAIFTQSFRVGVRGGLGLQKENLG